MSSVVSAVQVWSLIDLLAENEKWIRGDRCQRENSLLGKRLWGWGGVGVRNEAERT